MRIKKIFLNSFRNLHTAEVRFDKRVVALVGKNGQGKTNLIEALYLLAQAKSFRKVNPKEIAKWQNNSETEQRYEFDVGAEVETRDGLKEIQYKLREGKRQVFVNGNRVKSADEFYGQFTVVEFHPDSLQIIKGPPSERRTYLNRVIAMLDSAYVEALVAYEKALKNRNTILRNLKSTKAQLNTQESRMLLEPWDSVLAKNAEIICRKRIAYLEAVEGYFKEAYQNLLSFSDAQASAAETSSLSYESSFTVDGRVRTAEEILECFTSNHEKDLSQYRTTIGPQRDEILIQLDTGSGLKNSRSCASQGQARTLVLALKIATLRYIEAASGDTPLMLFDDIESELDGSRKDALFSFIGEAKAQVFVTLTELSGELRARLGEAQIMKLENGAILEQKEDVSS